MTKKYCILWPKEAFGFTVHEIKSLWDQLAIQGCRQSCQSMVRSWHSNSARYNPWSAWKEYGHGILVLHRSEKYRKMNWPLPSWATKRRRNIIRAGVVSGKQPGVVPDQCFLNIKAHDGDTHGCGGYGGISVAISPAIHGYRPALEERIVAPCNCIADACHKCHS